MTDLTAAEWKMMGIAQEGHLTNVEMAEKLGMAPSPCLRRMKSPKDRGFIERTVSVLNRKMLGLEILAEVDIKVLQTNSRSMYA